ncbi:hypothetical protein [Halothermothrix orenii]|uniref:DUF4829 domain-containing protein n=1 Tax=Halothermothrix orenii (strain H 168 / OCM 544 / DSM 9562) TaxID=373903 RepID=B8CWN9_HALOH|nr:hypothetical protein [Halothermothrix orenii]ACL69708.1 hypothetical protein Hore_09520 [Halothermothrix orenii H 168]
MGKKKIILIIVTIIFIISLITYKTYMEKNIIKEVVIEFGSNLKKVSLQSPEDKLIKDINKYYKDYVTRELLNKWLTNPSKVPGRSFSSPWPEEIEIKKIKNIGGDKYRVIGIVKEVTSKELVKGEPLNRYQVELIVKKIKNKWLISDYRRLPCN